MANKVNFNEDEVRKLTKREFIDMHQHHKDDVDLEAEYDRINPPKKPVKKD